MLTYRCVNAIIKSVEGCEYHPAKMQLRNCYMCDNYSIVIAVWNGSNGGVLLIA